MSETDSAPQVLIKKQRTNFENSLKERDEKKKKKEKKELGEREPWERGTRVNLPF